VPFFIKPFTGKVASLLESEYLNHNYESHLSFLEGEMTDVATETKNAASNGDPNDGPFISGPKLTAADFMMAFPLEAAQQIAGLTKAKHPLLTAYIARVQSRDAYKKAVERIIKETGDYVPGI